jgi:large subunit ribosomal protein L13
MARAEDVEHDWYVVDAAGKTLGRLASAIAAILRGKHKPIFTPHVDTGDHVIVINAERVVLTGKKSRTKMYFRHSLYPGGLRAVPAGELLRSRPETVVERAIRGMLPHNRLGRQMFKKLQVYRGSAHPHAAQEPRPLEL